MARANRHILPGHVWHITHRCHKREFLLKFARDRKRWIHWLYEAKRRYGLSVLNYTVTSNHVHLLVRDRGKQELPASMQLAAGCVAQEYNRRKSRKGAFWEDRYHATAVATDEHLIQCLLYIDLNMVRTGVVSHPGDWPESGYSELVSMRQRYTVHDIQALMELLAIDDPAWLVTQRQAWVEQALDNGLGQEAKDPRWTGGIAVGSYEFVESVQLGLGQSMRGRSIVEFGGSCVLREEETGYVAILP
jgi:putative transposase